MTKKLTLKELKQAEIAFGRLLEQRLPVKVAYALSRFVRGVKAELEALEEARGNLVRKLGTKDGNGNVSVQPDRMVEFTEDLDMLLRQEVVVPVHLLSLDELEGTTLTIGDIAALSFIIKEEEDNV